MNILVTGGAGYVGSHIVLALRDRGRKVVVLDNLVTGNRSLVAPDVPFVEGSCGDPLLVRELIRSNGIEAVIHCAGLVSVAESVALPLDYYEANVGQAIGLIDGAIAGGAKRFLFSSTATVYGAQDAERLDETMAVDPLSPYAAGKAMVERILADVARTGALDVMVLRYFNVAGADPAGRAGQICRNATHLIKLAAEAATGKRDHVKVTGTDFPTEDGTGVRDYIHVSDLADAHLAVLDAAASGNSFGIFNVGYGRGRSVLEVLDCVDRVAGRPVRRVLAPRRPGDVPRLVADPSRIMNEIGWRPRYDDLETIVADAIRWERQMAAVEAGKPQAVGRAREAMRKFERSTGL